MPLTPFRLATDEDIARMSAVFVTGRLAKKLGEHQRHPGQELAQDRNEPAPESIHPTHKAILDHMTEIGLEHTRANYIRTAYPDGLPENYDGWEEEGDCKLVPDWLTD